MMIIVWVVGDFFEEYEELKKTAEFSDKNYNFSRVCCQW